MRCAHAAVSLTLALLVLPAAALAERDPRCLEVSQQVALTAGGPADQTLRATLCAPVGSPPDTIQMLVPGSTYTRYYWDFDYRPMQYSYVRYANATGMATLNLDRIGTGESSHPPSDQLGIPSNAHVLHQVVQALRAGSLGPSRFERVVLVGHSLGTLIALYEAAQYGDVDGVVASGFAHFLGPAGETFFDFVHPAQLDPKFADAGLDAGYFTTIPGSRAQLFYNLDVAEPAVIERDEQLKQTVTIGELTDSAELGLQSPEQSFTRDVQVPVLIAVGERDALVCPASGCQEGALRAQESPYYPAVPRLDVAVIGQSAHDLNLHQRAPAFFVKSLRWIAELETGSST